MQSIYYSHLIQLSAPSHPPGETIGGLPTSRSFHHSRNNPLLRQFRASAGLLAAAPLFLAGRFGIPRPRAALQSRRRPLPIRKVPNQKGRLISRLAFQRPSPRTHSVQVAFFSFLYLKKLKFQKYMTVPRNFKNGPLSPRQGATCLF